MAVKTGVLIEKLFKKAGIDTNNEELKPIFAIDTEMPDEYANKVDGALLTLEAAKGNPEINRMLRKSHFDTVDQKLVDIIKESGVTLGDDYEKEPNTLLKIGILSKALIDAGKRKAESTNKEGVHEQLKKQADEFAGKEATYQKQLKDIADSMSAKEKEFYNTRETDLTEFNLDKVLSGKDYIFPKEMDSDVKVNAAKLAVKNELAKQGLVIKRNEAGQLVITDKEGNPGYTKTHEKVETNSFIDGVLAQNKLLKINDPENNNGNNGSNGTQNNISNNRGNKNTAVINEINAQLAHLPD
ncbi:MAG: hypothetical protein ABI237_05965 [Ginsengibacter sp.]